MSPDLDADTYSEILQAMAIAWHACERPLRALRDSIDSVPVWLDLGLLELSALIDEDLETLASSHPVRKERLSVSLSLDPNDLHQMAGLSYVLSGSRQGARAILTQLLKHPDPKVPSATTHFRAAAEPVISWQQCSRALDQTLDKPEHVEQACMAAVQTFDLWLAIMEADESPLRRSLADS